MIINFNQSIPDSKKLLRLSLDTQHAGREVLQSIAVFNAAEQSTGPQVFWGHCEAFGIQICWISLFWAKGVKERWKEIGMI